MTTPFDADPVGAPSLEDERAQAVVELQGLLLATDALEELVDAIAQAAGERLGAAVTVTLQRAGRARSAGSNDDRAHACDEVEYRADEGPCLTAMETGTVQRVRDVRGDDRWPAWREAALAHGFRSSAGVPARVREGVDVSLNLYADSVDAFDDGALAQAQVYADEVARAITLSLRWAEQAEINADLRAALASRAVIDQALGVVMAQNRCSAQEAFRVLKDASQRRNLKLRDVATALVASVSGAPPDAPKDFRPRE